jgi:glycosyltransferase involved in cell wall biosynthesis
MRKPFAASENTPRALFLSPESPYPTIGGGPIRSASVLEYLCRHYSVDTIVFQETAAPPGKINRMETIHLPYHSKHTIARVIRNSVRLLRNRPPLLDRFSGFHRKIADFISGQQYDLAVIEHFWCAPYAAELRPCCKTIWLDLHNIESVWHRRLAEQNRGAHALAHDRFARAYATLERIWLPKYDALLVTSSDDAAHVARISPGPNVVIYPNTLPSADPIERNEDDVIAFSGNLEYEPNQAALRFFLQRIWPLIRQKSPSVKFRILGKNPHAVRRLTKSDARIELIGPMDDAIASLAKAKVAVVPLQSGSGTRIKILEAWAAAAPVVSTTIGAEGLECRDGEHLLIADEPSQFADRVSELLGSPERRVELGQAGRKLCRDRYTWATAWEALDRLRR